MAAHHPPTRLNLLKVTGGRCLRIADSCPSELCRYSLNVTDSREGMRWRSREPVTEHRCAIAAANEGGVTLEQVALRLGVVRERVRQIEERSLLRLRERLEELGVRSEDAQDALQAAAQRGHGPTIL